METCSMIYVKMLGLKTVRVSIVQGCSRMAQVRVEHSSALSEVIKEGDYSLVPYL